MEQSLLKLLNEFNSGELRAFDSAYSLEQMESVRDQQEALGELLNNRAANTVRIPPPRVDSSYAEYMYNYTFRNQLNISVKASKDYLSLQNVQNQSYSVQITIGQCSQHFGELFSKFFDSADCPLVF
jgi:hypothetical protein